MTGPPIPRIPVRGAPQDVAHRILTRLADRGRPLVALDHDGTLSPIAPRPADAVLEVGALDAIVALAGVAEVAVVSGRGLDDLVARFDGLPVTLVSEHGLRARWPDGRETRLVRGLDPDRLDALRRRLDVLLPSAARDEGWLVEDKGVGIAVHHRLVPTARLEPTLSTVRAALAEADPDGQVQEGKAVLELRAAGADKANALSRLLETSDATVPVMIGDDLTDEPALALAERHGGVGVLVATDDRQSSASVRVADPSEVVALLTDLAAGLTRAELTRGR